jgi:diacylglycerol O-acyltransferase
VQTGVTNVPGPQHPLHTLGRRLLESYPYVPVIGNVRISIAIFSYDGGLYFGVTGDYDSSSDVGILTNGVERAMDELLAALPETDPTQVGGSRTEASSTTRA